MTTHDAKTYLAKREIPQLFESLMTGLMYHKPPDHIKFLMECLQKVQEKGCQDITWSSFVDIRRGKTPLPPIDKRRPGSKGSSKGSRPSSRTKTPKDGETVSKEFETDSREGTPVFIGISHGSSPFVKSAVPETVNVLSLERNEETTPKDLTDSQPLPSIQKVALPDCPVVVVMGAPGSDKAVHVEKLLKRYPGWEHVNMGALIKDEVSQRGEGGHTKWRMVRDLYSKGDAVPEDVVVEILTDRLKQCSKAKGIVINGFPRSMAQLGHYDKVVGRVDCVFMLDCDEQAALDKLLRRGRDSGKPEDSMSSVASRLNYFKINTLPCAKHFDDQGKLVVIDGDQGEERVEYDLGKAFDNMFLSKYGAQPQGTEEPPKSAGPLPPPPTYKGKYEDTETEEEEKPLFTGPIPEPPVIDVSDQGRQPDLPQCPIVFVAGGPGSGKGTQCDKIVQRYPGFVHLSMGDILREEISTKGTADEKWDMISQLLSKGDMAPEEDIVDLLKENLKKNSSAKAFLVEGFPRNKEQVEAFNKHIGGLNFVLLFDCEEYYMQNRLIKRGKESGRIDDNISAIAKKLHYYKHNTLPVLKYYDDLGKLVVKNITDLDADRDMEEMFFDISKLFDFAFYGDESGEKTPELPEDEKLAADALKIKAAIKIQANYRGYMVRSGKWDIFRNKHKEAITDDDKQQETENIDPATQQAATRIQAGYRGYKARSEVKTRREEAQRQDEAASRIQAGFRGYKVRSEMKDKKQDKHKPSPDQRVKNTQRACSRIQAGYHGYKTRSEFKARRQSQHEQSPDQEMKDTQRACSRIQAGYHGYKTRSEFKARRQAQQREPSPDQELTWLKDRQRACSRILAGYHGYKTRSAFKTRRHKQGERQEMKDRQRARSRIQAGYHGYKTRTEFKTRRHEQGEHQEMKDRQRACSRVQAGYHGYKTRTEFKARREAQQGAKQPSPEPAQEEVVEATITPQAGTTTGDNIANPDYSQKLDEAAKQEEASS